jgi:hypothetical protein
VALYQRATRKVQISLSLYPPGAREASKRSKVNSSLEGRLGRMELISARMKAAVVAGPTRPEQAKPARSLYAYVG